METTTTTAAARITFPKTRNAQPYNWEGLGLDAGRRSAEYAVLDASGTLIGTITNLSSGAYMEPADWTARILEDTTTTLRLGCRASIETQIQSLRQATTISADTLGALKATIREREARRMES